MSLAEVFSLWILWVSLLQLDEKYEITADYGQKNPPNVEAGRVPFVLTVVSGVRLVRPIRQDFTIPLHPLDINQELDFIQRRIDLGFPQVPFEDLMSDLAIR